MDTSARVPGVDGEKMSKSYGNTLEVFEEPKALRKQIMRIVTDSRPMEQPKEPGTDHLFQLYSLFAGDAQREAMAATYRRGGFGYGEVKKALADLAVDYFAEARERRRELEAHPERVREILGDGAARARTKAAEVLAPGPAGVRGEIELRLVDPIGRTEKCQDKQKFWLAPFSRWLLCYSAGMWSPPMRPAGRAYSTAQTSTGGPSNVGPKTRTRPDTGRSLTARSRPRRLPAASTTISGC